MHTQNRPISKKFLTPPHLFEPGSEKMGVFLKRKLKVPSLVWNGKRFLGGVFEKIFLKNKNLLSIHRTERRKWVESYKIVKYRSETEALQINFPNLKICWFWETKRQKWVKPFCFTTMLFVCKFFRL